MTKGQKEGKTDMMLVKRIVAGESHIGWISGAGDMYTLFNCFEDFLVIGKTIEILGYYPDPLSPNQRDRIRADAINAERLGDKA